VSPTTGHPHFERWSHDSHYYPLLRAAIPRGATRVLDVRCGDRAFAGFIACPSRLVIGVDIDDPRPVTDGGTGPARPVVGGVDHGPVRHLIGSAEALGFADATFDAVILRMVLHRVDAHLALGEAVRVLRPGGLLQVLGIGRYGGPRELPQDVRDVLVSQLPQRARQPRDRQPTPADPVETWAQALTTARRRLPGCAWRQLPMWRYLLTWTRPMAADPQGVA
jgi:SAM-dependent methyltransferase